MKKILISVALVGICILPFMFGNDATADGAYYQNSGAWNIAIDTGVATTADTTKLYTPAPVYRFRAVVAKIKFNNPSISTRGWQLTDSVRMILRTSLGDGQSKVVDSATRAVPCSLFTRLTVNQSTVGDTLLWKDLWWDVVFTDTSAVTSNATADSIVTNNYPWYWEVIVRE